jgi:hypothetical protein
MTTAAQVERVFREEHGRVLAALISQFEDFDLAEDALQDALVNSLERWQVNGIPENPGSWLTPVARRRAIDRIRQTATLQRSLLVLDPQLSYEELGCNFCIHSISWAIPPYRHIQPVLCNIDPNIGSTTSCHLLLLSL